MDDLRLPVAMAGEEPARNVLALYDALWERVATIDGRPSSDPEQALALWQEEVTDVQALAAGNPRLADRLERRKVRTAFDAGFARGVAFTRWLDAILADPLTRRDLLGLMLQEHCWLVMDETERAAYFGEPPAAEGPSSAARAA